MYAVCEPIVDQFMVNLWSSYGQIVNAPTFVPPPHFVKTKEEKYLAVAKPRNLKLRKSNKYPKVHTVSFSIFPTSIYLLVLGCLPINLHRMAT